MIFSLVGAGLLLGALAGFTGWRSDRQRPLGKGGTALTWRENKHFPKLRTHAPGHRGRARLRPEQSAAAKFLVILIVALIWNGISMPVAYNALPEFRGGWGWFPAIFLGLFLLIGLILLAVVPYQFLRWITVGDPYIELDAEPEPPGSALSVRVHQPGDFVITSLTVTLLCREIVTYRVGTSTETFTQEVFNQPLIAVNGTRAHAREPLATAEAFIPADAMHSFRSANNRVAWGFHVKLDIPGRPDVDDFFPFRVSPEWRR
ncbi:hypothetical protein HZA57_04120 [Candidatus Poribacteria bacterium]|nr:hypothetical protein [Candidatus Poribacteria bacterium]